MEWPAKVTIAPAVDTTTENGYNGQVNTTKEPRCTGGVTGD